MQVFRNFPPYKTLTMKLKTKSSKHILYKNKTQTIKPNLENVTDKSDYQQKKKIQKNRTKKKTIYISTKRKTQKLKELTDLLSQIPQNKDSHYHQWRRRIDHEPSVRIERENYRFERQRGGRKSKYKLLGDFLSSG